MKQIIQITTFTILAPNHWYQSDQLWKKEYPIHYQIDDLSLLASFPTLNWFVALPSHYSLAVLLVAPTHWLLVLLLARPNRQSYVETLALPSHCLQSVHLLEFPIHYWPVVAVLLVRPIHYLQADPIHYLQAVLRAGPIRYLELLLQFFIVPNYH